MAGGGLSCVVCVRLLPATLQGTCSLEAVYVSPISRCRAPARWTKYCRLRPQRRLLMIFRIEGSVCGGKSRARSELDSEEGLQGKCDLELVFDYCLAAGLVAGVVAGLVAVWLLLFDSDL